MSGIKNYNYKAFKEYAIELRALGHFVMSPAEQDVKKGWNKIKPFPRRKALGCDLKWICMKAEAIAMMPGWEHSSGAVAEWAAARAVGIEFIYLE